MWVRFTDSFFFFFQAEDGIRYHCVTGVQTCALPISWLQWDPSLETHVQRRAWATVGLKMADSLIRDGTRPRPIAPAVKPLVPAPKGPVARVVDRVVAFGPVRWLIPILAEYDLAGGGLLAAGLAFNSLFAVLPAILLVVAVVGVILGDAGRLAVI